MKSIPYNTVSRDHVIRVALYIRVSTEEQAIHGDSLAAQEESLIAYAKEHNMKIVGIYRDEGNSARKPALKRPVMLELLEDVKEGKIDRILFIKLDRWFRNVREYHKVQSILDEHNVTWQATMEDYNTATADGRLKVNIMLSVAENEADRTAERVKFVLESKRRRKELCFGGGTKPFGYKAEMIDGVRRLVKDPETKPMANDFWDHVRKYNSVRLAGLFVNEKYGLKRRYKTWADMSRTELYTGTHRGVEDFCPAYITHEEWEYLQQSHVKIKKTQRPERVYLFTGLLRCPGCGGTLKATFKTYPKDRSIEYKSYRCNNGKLGMCSYRSNPTEKKIEKYLLQNVKAELEEFILNVEVQGSTKKKKSHVDDIVKLNEEMRRLNTIYRSGNMEDDEYARESADLKKRIAAVKKAEQDDRPPDLEVLKQFLDSDFESIYNTLSQEDKRRMWRSIISEIHFDGPNITSIKFRA